MSLRILMLLSALVWVAASAIGQSYSGHQAFTVLGYDVFIYPPGVDRVFVHLRGAGSSGGGSPWIQFGGAGGSGAFVACVVPRPAQGAMQTLVGAGGAAVPAGLQADGNPGGVTAFGQTCQAHGGPGGQAAAGPNVGGDGGAGGVPWPLTGGDVTFYLLGGQGQASSPVIHDMNTSFPMGAPAPMGGAGGNNWQDGQTPGGGGAPGNSQLPSGRGGHGRIDIYW